MAFVFTAGQLRAISSQPTQPAWPSGVRLSATLSQSYEQIWRTQPAVRTVVGFLARNVAQLGVDVFRRKSPTDREKLVEHPVARLLERPQPGSKWTKYRLLNTLMHDLLIYDDAYLLKMRLEGELRALVPIPPTMIRPTGGSWFAAQRYEINGSTDTREVDADEVVHIHGYNPSDPRSGVPPVETLRQVLAEEHAATSYREQLWRNGARVAGYLQRPKDAPRWSKEARERFRDSWQAQYAGDGPSSGGTPILEDGMHFAASGVSPKDAQYVESRKLTREEVAVAYHVPPVMIGLMDGATFSNITEMHKMLYQDTLAPYLSQLAQDLENQLLEDVDPTAGDGQLYIEFNLSEKLRGSFSEQAQALQSAVGAPWMTRAEARAMFNLSDVDGASELIVPLNVIEGGLASPRDTAPDAPPALAGDVVAKHLRRQRRAVVSSLRAPGYDGIDAQRWESELLRDLRDAGVEQLQADDTARLLTQRAAAGVRAALELDDPLDAVETLYDELAKEHAA